MESVTLTHNIELWASNQVLEAKMEKSLTNQTAAVEKDAVGILENQQEGEQDEDPFNRLPDELIISQIFDRLSEVSYLFMCSLVSRRFASLILQTHNVSVTIPCIIQSQSLSFPQKFRKFLSEPFSFLKELLHPTKQLNTPSYDLDKKFLSSIFSGFLGNLSSVHNLKAEVSCPGSEIKEFSVRWLFEFKSANSGRLIILFFKSLTAAVAPDTDDADDNSNTTGNGYHEMSIDDAISFGSFMTTDVLLFYHLLRAVVPFFPVLKTAVISDSSKQGRLVVREDKIVQMRAGDDEALKDIDVHLKVWDEAVLKLPVSGVVMKDVRLGIVQSKVEGEVRHDELIAEDTNFEFEEDEGEMGAFREAVTEMMKNDTVLEENLTLQESASS